MIYAATLVAKLPSQHGWRFALGVVAIIAVVGMVADAVRRPDRRPVGLAAPRIPEGAAPVLLPDRLLDNATMTFTWLVRAGAPVKVGQPILTYDYKGDVIDFQASLDAPVDGVLTIIRSDGDVCFVGEILAHVDGASAEPAGSHPGATADDLA